MDVWKRSSTIYDCFFLSFRKFLHLLWDFFPHFRNLCIKQKGRTPQDPPFLSGWITMLDQAKVRRPSSVKRASAPELRQVFMIVTVVKVISASRPKTGI